MRLAAPSPSSPRFLRYAPPVRRVVLLLFVCCGGSGAGAMPVDEPDAAMADAGPMDATGADADRDAEALPDASQDASEPDAAEPDAAPDASAGLGPPYPVVLAHGFFGFDNFAGLGFAQYFYQVKDALADEGETLVFTPAVDPFNDSTVRGEQLLEAMEEILAETGHAKVNLIGHSQGGLDCRYAAHVRPDLVASVTTISSPHRTTPVADATVDLVGSEPMAMLVDALSRAIGAPLFDAAGDETSVVAALRQLTSEGISQFNREFPNDSSVDYFSIAGRSDLVYAREECEAPDAPSFVTDFDSDLDPIDPLLFYVEEVTDGGVFGFEPNDGLVRVEDAKWGTFLGCIPADHFDQIGQVLGDFPGVFNSWRHKPFYRDLVGYLRDQGY